MKHIKTAIAACAFLTVAAAVSAQEQPPAAIMARTVCFDEIRVFEAAYAQAGKTLEQTSAVLDDVLKSFVPAGEDRTHVLTNVEKVKKSVVTPTSAPTAPKQIAVVFCAATVGAAAEGGMRDLGAFRALWATERTTTFGLADPAWPPPAASSAAPETSPSVDGCIVADWGAGKRGEPGLLRNTCDFALNVGYCVSQPAAGSTSESISCEASRQTSYEIGPRSAALLLMTNGPNVTWRACRPPHEAFLWFNDAGQSAGECRAR